MGGQKTYFDPYISTPGMNYLLNNVNQAGMTPIFPLQAWFWILGGGIM